MVSRLAAVFFVFALLLAVVFGPLLEMWAWGPALLGLGAASGFAVVALLRKGCAGMPVWLFWFGAVVFGWFGLRALYSPVGDHALSDALLMLGGGSAFLITLVVVEDRQASRILGWGLAALVIASVLLVVLQIRDPGFRIQFGRVREELPGGFFGSYSEGANFLVGCSLIVGGIAVFGPGRRFERILWGVAALAGFAAVLLMRSRGGMVGGAVGLGLLMILALVQAKRQESKWFGIGVIAIPLMGVAAALFLLWGWEFAQESRFGEASYDKLMDNTSRLHMASVAVACIAKHPWAGGGSRSFSWECYREWDVNDYGYLGGRPDLVHNELLEAFADYGIVGGVLLLSLVGTVMITAVVRLLASWTPAMLRDRGGWVVGGLAAVGGMLAQSNFNFVFHLIPSMLLLGCGMALVCGGGGRGISQDSGRRGRIGLGFAGMVSVVGCLSAGVLGTGVCLRIWAFAYGNGAEAQSRSVDDFRAARLIWPQYDLDIRLAVACHMKGSEASDGKERGALLREAYESYGRACRANPFEPYPVLAGAGLAELLGDDAAAESLFVLGSRLQGQLELLFKGNLNAAEYYERRARVAYAGGNIDIAMDYMTKAVASIDRAMEVVPALPVFKTTFVAVHETRGILLENSGLFGDAYQEFEVAGGKGAGPTARYRAGKLLSLEADRIWKLRKPGEALFLFQLAQERVRASGSVEIHGITTEQRKALSDFIQESIRALREGKVTPKKVEPFAD